MHSSRIQSLALAAVALGTSTAVSARGELPPYQYSFGENPILSIAGFAPQTPIHICTSPDASPEVVESVYQSILRINSRYNAVTSWDPNNNTPRTLTYSLVPDGLAMPSGGVTGEVSGSNTLFATLDAQFAGEGGRAEWIRMIDSAFARWSQLTGLRYQRVSVPGQDWDDGAAWGSGASATRGDIRIAAKLINGVNGVLAYNYYPLNGDMVLDNADNWSQGTQNRFFRNVLSHEHGHGMGLAHSCPADGTRLMQPSINTGFDGPQQDDLRGAQENYGDFYEPNQDTSAASLFGTINVGSTLTIGNTPVDPVFVGVPIPSNTAITAISPNNGSADIDVYRFSVTQSCVVTVNVTPIGTTYLAGAQNSNGTCQPGVNTNALAAADLRFDIVNSTGTTVFGAGNATPAGNPETAAVALTAGTYHVRVTAVSDPSLVQMYTTSIQVSPPNTAPNLSAIPTQTINDGVATGLFTAVGSDSDSPAQTLTYSLIGAPAGASINPSSGAFSWSPTLAQRGSSYNFSVQVTDNGLPNLSTTRSVTVNVPITSKTFQGTLNLGSWNGSYANLHPFSLEFQNQDLTRTYTYPSSTLSAVGAFSVNVTNLPAATYTVFADARFGLRRSLGTVSIAPSSTNVLNPLLINGDADNSNEVGPGDLQLILDNFGNNSAAADVDGDGEVGPGDLQIVLDNFGIEGD